jgi:hypothetical protein
MPKYSIRGIYGPRDSMQDLLLDFFPRLRLSSKNNPLEMSELFTSIEDQVSSKPGLKTFQKLIS